MAKNTTRSSSAGNAHDNKVVPYQGAAPLPLLDEFDDDTDASWTSWREAAHGAGEWESSPEDMHLSVE